MKSDRADDPWDLEYIPLAVVSAVVSAVGITLSLGTWPKFNTAAALGLNVVAVLVALE